MSHNGNNGTSGDILVVDDALANVRLLSKVLSKSGYQVRGVTDGEMALTAVEADPPDLILLDIKMPGMSGYDVCHQLKAVEATRPIPVIFISAMDETIDKVKAFNVGGVDYITKPFQVPELLVRVQTHLTMRALQRQLESQVAQLQGLMDQLKKSNQALQTSNAELDAFAHTVAHDLKNPLGTIMLSVDFLKGHSDKIGQEKSAEILSDVFANGSKITNIIDELLLLASVRKENVKSHMLNMTNIIHQAKFRLSSMIQEYGGEIIEPDFWPAARGYAPWIEEVWVNYLSNGLKYGGAPPRLELGADYQENGMVRFWVRDNGLGIEPEKLSSIFTEFNRLEQVRAKGYGLGLSIVHRIVQKLDGQVGVESQLSEGSLFYFSLPAVD